ncbi:MAG: OmpA family protein [Prevotellaceae bacterium]|jgi:outer membrane protein OmpA-like peptidoglycan-associated protein|nr:OmpA family protein [Prevotellaceae bacterium]
MKKNVSIIVSIPCLLFGMLSCGTGANFINSIGTALGSAIIQQAAVQGGMSEQDAKQAVGDIAEGLGFNRQASDIGMSWRDGTLNKYDKQSIVLDYALDGMGEVTGQQELMNRMKNLKDADFNYLSRQRDIVDEARKTNTPVNKQRLQEASNRRNQEREDVIHNAVLYGKEKQRQHLQELLPIKQKLVAQGYESWVADEVAATIIGIQRSTYLTEAEKAEWLRGLGFDNYQEVSKAVEKVLADNYYTTTNDVEAKIKTEEAKHQAEIQRQQYEEKVAEERRNAIKKIETAKIDGYSLDETVLSQNQKTELDTIADVLNRYSDIKVFIIGHTCEIGYKNINLKKGLKRSKTVMNYLIEKGISQNRISIDSKGETQPLVPNTSSENRKKNRRIEFIIE